jgi:very-short-patch-repair endonuclease
MAKTPNKHRARALRQNQTQTEGLLWSVLRDRRLGGWKWRRQVARGPYIVDFFCAEARLVVELDGSQHQAPDAVAYDTRRTACLERLGLRVLRIESAQVLVNLDGVCRDILYACGGAAELAAPNGALFGQNAAVEPPPHPALRATFSPRGGEGSDFDNPSPLLGEKVARSAG